jgi:uncharacterized LabA/DUF88 family protein
MNAASENRIAVLIDADNAQASIIEGLLAEISKYGVASTKRIYGDWTKQQASSWKAVLMENGINPVQQFNYTTGKNATDSAMIIDAMDLLYSNKFDIFCIVSSDSDFTRLASRIRESGSLVFGFGEKKTPQSFVSSCDKFIYTEILRTDKNITSKTTVKASKKELNSNTKLINLLKSAVESAADETGFANLAQVGQKVANQSPDFDSRNYGYDKLGELIRATGLFDIDMRIIDEKGNRVKYIRDKEFKA